MTETRFLDGAAGGIAGRPRLRRPPAVQGRGGLWTVIIVLLVGLAVLLVNWWLDTPVASISNRAELFAQASRIVGLVAGYVLLLQIVLRSRVGFLERWVGTELLTRWHRDLGPVLLLTVLTHAALAIVGYSTLDRISYYAELRVLMTEYEDLTSAVVATGILIAIALLAIRAVKHVLPYELWKFLHLASYLVLLLAYGHQFANGQQLFRPGFTRWYWLALHLAVVAFLFWGRFVLPLWLNVRQEFRVAGVVQESPDAISIYLRARYPRQVGRAGQFYRWRFLSGGLWLQAHPFSLSKAANGRNLRLTVKMVGQHTQDLRDLRVGVRVWAQGPMGSFTAVRRTRGRALLIAAGIGIAPVRALLEELPAGATVVYRASTAADVLLRAELDRIAVARDAEVWYVIGARTDPAPRALLTGSGMLQIVPDVAHRDVYLCGPGGFVVAARRALRQAGVPRRQVHDTMFEL